MNRVARVERLTHETQIMVELDLDGIGVVEVGTGVPFFDHMLVPLDETLVQAVVDLSGRPYVVHHEPDGMAPLIGSYDTTLTRHIFESLAFAAGICLHVRVIEGRNPHHIVEAQFKAVARALRAAAAPDPRAGGIPSTKGVLS